jgi:hypothetical protein
MDSSRANVPTIVTDTEGPQGKTDGYMFSTRNPFEVTFTLDNNIDFSNCNSTFSALPAGQEIMAELLTLETMRQD